jgi:hypothetical protein
VRREILRDEALIPEIRPDIAQRAVSIAIAGNISVSPQA